MDFCVTKGVVFAVICKDNYVTFKPVRFKILKNIILLILIFRKWKNLLNQE